MITPAIDFKTFLPLVYNSLPAIGVQDETKGIYADRYAAASRVHLPLRWDWCHEQGIGIYNHLPAIAAAHWTIVGIRGTPDEYKLWPDIPCSPPAPAHYQAAADFFLEALEYTGAQAVAIYNEPEMAPSPESLPFMGCWGVDYTSGFDYGKFCGYIYDAVKSALPNVTVIAGEFSGSPNLSFWNGFLAGSGRRFDALSFHNYALFGQPYARPDAIVNQLRIVCQRLFWTEVALLTDGDCTPEFQAAQAEHLDRAMQYTYELGIECFFWYTIGGNNWRHSDLLSCGQDTPAYQRYLFYGRGGL